MEIPAVIKQHPYIAGGAVLLAIFAMSRGGSSTANSSAGNIGATLQSQQIAGQTNVQLAGINASESIARANNAKEMYIAGATTAGAVAINNNASMTTALQNLLASNDTEAAIAAKSKTDLATVNAGQTISLANIAAQLQAVISGNNTSQTIALDSAQKSYNLGLDTNATKLKAIEDSLKSSDYQLGVNVGAARDMFSSNLSFTSANLPALLKHSENMATISGNTATTIANIKQGNTAAPSKSDLQTVSDSTGLIGNIVSGAGNIFKSIGSIFGL